MSRATSSSYKQLLLLRHAKAVPADGASPDLGRPLAVRGERDGHRMGERMRQRHARLDLILASPALRTRRTAELVASTFGYAHQNIAFDERLYLADPAEIIAVIAAQDPTVDRLLVVGHNPGITDLAHQLVPDLPVDDLPTAAVVALDTDIRTWADLPRAASRLAYYDFPKNPSAPTTVD